MTTKVKKTKAKKTQELPGVTLVDRIDSGVNGAVIPKIDAEKWGGQPCSEVPNNPSTLWMTLEPGTEAMATSDGAVVRTQGNLCYVPKARLRLSQVNQSWSLH